jgi:hypothetical protein
VSQPQSRGEPAPAACAQSALAPQPEGRLLDKITEQLKDKITEQEQALISAL